MTLVLFALACTCSLNTRQFLLGCYWQDCVPEREFHVLDWEIPARFFPVDAKFSHIYIPSEGMGEIESGSQAIFWNNGNGIAGYDIYRYPTVKKAQTQYERIAKGMVDDGTKNPWTRPDDVTFTSSTAEETFVGCGDWTGKRCGLLARYQEYVLFFTIVLDEKMTYADFEKIAIYLDDEVSSRLYP
jgi:hypothetical protein